MRKITGSISSLEQEITQNRQAAYSQYHQTKNKLANNLTSAPAFILAFITGALISKNLIRGKGKTIKATSKNETIKIKPKLSLVEKVFALVSQASIALNFINRFKHLIRY